MYFYYSTVKLAPKLGQPGINWYQGKFGTVGLQIYSGTTYPKSSLNGFGEKIYIDQYVRQVKRARNFFQLFLCFFFFAQFRQFLCSKQFF